MQQVLLPLFPLQAVLFPRTPMPLHIFEERYREMIGEALETQSEFGIVLAARKGIANLGCTAVIERVVERYEDGRLDIATAGRRRFEIQSVDDERSFLRGKVEFFDDEDEATGGEGVIELSDEVRKRASDLWKEMSSVTGIEREPLWDDPQLSFQIADGIPDLEFRQSLLGIRSEARRMRQIQEFFPAYLHKQRHIHHVQTVAPRNGHGKHKVESDS